MNPLSEIDFLREALRLAKLGDHSNAEELLHAFLTAVEHGHAIPQPIIDYLYQAFHGYLINGLDVEAALLLKRPAHRVRGSGRPRRTKRGRIYNEVIAAALLHLLVRRRMTKEMALAILDDHHIRQRSAQRWHSEYNALATMSTRELKRLILDQRESAKKH